MKRAPGPKPVPPELEPMLRLLWESLRTTQKVNNRGGRLVHLQGLRYAAARMYADGWRVQAPPE